PSVVTKIVRNLLRDARNAIFDVIADEIRRRACRKVVLLGKDRNDSSMFVVDQQPDIVCYKRDHVSGLMRSLKSTDVLRNSRPVDLSIHDLNHLPAGGLADGFSERDLFQQSAHVAWRREAKRCFAFIMKLGGTWSGREGFEPDVGVSCSTDRIQ